MADGSRSVARSSRADDGMTLEEAHAFVLESTHALCQVAFKCRENRPHDPDTAAACRWLAKLRLNLAIGSGEDTPDDWREAGLLPPSGSGQPN